MIPSAAISKGLNIEAIRQQFPVLNREVKGKPLVYFDNAATSQKPQVVIDALVEYYSGYNANIHRGIHTLAEEATAARIEAAKAILEAPDPLLPSSRTEPATTFGEPSGSVLDLVLSVPAAVAHVVVALLRRPVQTGMDLVALVRR